MKRIYFVRHGQSVGNLGLINQDGTAPLTEKGKEQAAFIAKRCARLPVKKLIASPMVRAHETALIISKEISKEITFSELFVEQRNPSVANGRPKDDPEYLKSRKEIMEHFTEPGYRYSDEENFDDMKDRAKKTLEFLARCPEDDILVVTHGFFLRVLAAYVVHGEALTAKECQDFIRAFHMENTALSVFEYDETRAWAPWWLWMWNDHAHLGDIGESKGK